MRSNHQFAPKMKQTHLQSQVDKRHSFMHEISRDMSPNLKRHCPDYSSKTLINMMSLRFCQIRMWRWTCLVYQQFGAAKSLSETVFLSVFEYWPSHRIKPTDFAWGGGLVPPLICKNPLKLTVKCPGTPSFIRSCIRICMFAQKTNVASKSERQFLILTYHYLSLT
jgi:hypothetical protein